MEENISYERCKAIGKYIALHNATIAQTAIYFGIDEKTAEYEATQLLSKIDSIIAGEVRTVLALQNKKTRNP